MESSFQAVLPPGVAAYRYQLRVADELLAGKNLVLRAPTGCGKTLSALVPFIEGRKRGKYSRLIYCLPLRTLVRSIYQEAKRVVASLAPDLRVVVQTGEERDDPFFSEADIVVCTYDQLLSGMLAGPYGLSPRVANVNAACITGALVVFDEFHLMAVDRAFLTAAACLAQFGALTQSLWMSATATEPLVTELARAVGAEVVDLPAEDWAAVPSVSRIERTVEWHRQTLSVDEILKHKGKRVVVIVNQVDWAQSIFTELPKEADWPVRLLHSRFFRRDRDDTETWLREHFGKDGSLPALLICTQVIEAGVDITSDVLLTQLAPMSSLIQRAGRCARFPPTDKIGVTFGAVHVFGLPEEEGSHLPYEVDEVRLAREILEKEAVQPTVVTPKRALDWVQQAHAERDRVHLAKGWTKQLEEVLKRITGNALAGKKGSVSELIREADDSVRVFLCDVPPEEPSLREPLQLSRGRLRKYLADHPNSSGWALVWEAERPPWRPLTFETLRRCYYVALPPFEASYDSFVGLQLGMQGVVASPERQPPARPGYGSLHLETWEAHTRAVARAAEQRARRELPEASRAARALEERYGLDYPAFLAVVQFMSLFHDFGKLLARWQAWAIAYQRKADPTYAHVLPLAHTDYDARLSQHREYDSEVRAELGRRPPHAVPGAYAASWCAGDGLVAVSEEFRGRVASACCAAIVAHHGGWIPCSDVADLGCTVLSADWREVLPLLAARGILNPPIAAAWREREKRTCLQDLLEETSGLNGLPKGWPLVALLTRILRLSDQKATSEGAGDE